MLDTNTRLTLSELLGVIVNFYLRSAATESLTVFDKSKHENGVEIFDVIFNLTVQCTEIMFQKYVK